MGPPAANRAVKQQTNFVLNIVHINYNRNDFTCIKVGSPYLEIVPQIDRKL